MSLNTATSPSFGALYGMFRHKDANHKDPFTDYANGKQLLDIPPSDKTIPLTELKANDLFLGKALVGALKEQTPLLEKFLSTTKKNLINISINLPTMLQDSTLNSVTIRETVGVRLSKNLTTDKIEATISSKFQQSPYEWASNYFRSEKGIRPAFRTQPEFSLDAFELKGKRNNEYTLQRSTLSAQLEHSIENQLVTNLSQSGDYNITELNYVKPTEAPLFPFLSKLFKK